MKHFVVILEYADFIGVLADEVSAAQKEFLARLHAEGILLCAGPFADRASTMAVLRCDSLEQAEKFASESPVVRSGDARPEVREWEVCLGWPRG